MKKILISAYACNPQGSLQLHPGEDLTGWMFVKQLSRFYELHVLTHRYNEEGIRRSPERVELKNVHFVFVDLPRWLRLLYKVEFAQRIYYYLWQVRAWRVAIKLHRSVRFDAAQHLTFGNDWISSYIGAFLPVPFIWGPLGGGQRTPLALRSEYSIYGRFAETARGLAQWFGRRDPVRWRCLKRCAAMLVCNDETQALVPPKYLAKVHLFPVNGIAAEDLGGGPKSRGGSERLRVLTVGRLHRLKGFGLSLKAFSVFSSKCPEAELTIIGQGPEERRLQALVKELGLESRVRMIPWQPRTGVLAAMRDAHVFIFPSFRDGGGAVVVEAMASGLPVVCLKSGGPAFHAQPGWGVAVEPGPPERVAVRVASILEKLYLDESLRMGWGRAGRARAEDFYLWERMGERLNEIYARAMLL